MNKTAIRLIAISAVAGLGIAGCSSKKATPSAAFLALFNVSGVKWTCGSTNLSTYKVAGNSASYVVPLTAKDTAGTSLPPAPVGG